MEMDRATQRMVCVRVNPTRTYARVTSAGTSFITWQNGEWFGQGGAPLAADAVPEEYRADIVAHPVQVEGDGPTVIVACEFCGEKMNRANKDAHLVWHVRNAMAEAGHAAPVQPDVPPPTTVPSNPPAAPPRPGQRIRPDAV
jgi:hypothetical protein